MPSRISKLEMERFAAYVARNGVLVRTAPTKVGVDQAERVKSGDKKFEKGLKETCEMLVYDFHYVLEKVDEEIAFQRMVE